MRYLYFFLTLFITFGLAAQNENNLLPRGLSEQELFKVKEEGYIYPMTPNSLGAPDEPVRTMAEWEQLDGVVITWRAYFSILSQIVDALNDDTHVYIICNDSLSTQAYLANKGVSYAENVSFHEFPSNSVWVRDYGPNSAYLNDVEEFVFIDWIYNRPRPQDDVIPGLLAEELSIPIYATDLPPDDLVNTGGNFMADGMGNAFSSKLVLEENDETNQWGFSNHSEEEVDAIMNTYMGLDSYIKMDVLPFDLIHHIDMHMKLLDEETLIIGEYPTGVADGPQIEANLAYVLENFKTPYGNDYKVIRVPMPPDFFDDFPDNGGDYRTYANALIANSTILVPVYEEQYDTTALKIWEKNMPGYKVVGIDCNTMIPASGALHCITKEIGSSNPLLINMPHIRQACSDQLTPVRASIKHKAGISTANLYYKTDVSGPYSMIPMTVEADNVHWNAVLPAFELGTKVYYYVQAVANDGKSINRPIVAPEGYWEIEIMNCSVSTNEIDPELALIKSIYPNPASAITCIEMNVQLPFYGEIKLIDVFGNQKELIHKGLISSGEQRFFFNAGKYSSGTYLVQIIAREGSLIKKIVIQ